MKHPNVREHKLPPVLKWTGGKENELENIHAAMPKSFTNYYEPFVGGGATYFSIEAEKYFINDKYPDLMGLYTTIRSQDERVFEAIDEMMKGWVKLKDLAKTNSKHFYMIYTDLVEKRKTEDYIFPWAKTFEEFQSPFVLLRSGHGIRDA